MKIGGIQSFSTVDYPGMMSTVVYLQGCPWKCKYCYNGELIDPNAETKMKWNTVLQFLESRRGLLDAIVFSGGEPTLQRNELITAIDDVKDMGFKVGIHTSGIYPKVIKKVLPKLDWVGLDIKAAKDDYIKVTQAEKSGIKAWTSLRHVLESGVDYEVRTTVHPDIITHEMLESLTEDLKNEGVNNYVIQKVRPENCLDRTHRVVYNLINDNFINTVGKKFSNFKIR